MLVTCRSCGRPVYWAVGRSILECRYCYTRNAADDAKSRYCAPWELDWRKPLHDALTIGPPWDSVLRWLGPFGDDGDIPQRLDLARKELALQEAPPSSAGAGKRTTQDSQQPDFGQGFLARLLRHPFHLLDATPRSTREELGVRQAELALYGQEDDSREAFNALTHAHTRLAAEIRWFPRTAPDQVKSLVRYVQQARAADWTTGEPALVPDLGMKSALAQFNAVRLVFDAQEVRSVNEFRAALLSLAVLSDALYPGQVRDEINEDRAQAGFVSVDDDAVVEAQIAELMGETVACLMERGAGNLDPRELLKLSRQLQSLCVTRSSAYRNNYLLDAAAEYLQ